MWCLPFRALLVWVAWNCVSWAPLMMSKGAVMGFIDLEGLLGASKQYDCQGQALEGLCTQSPSPALQQVYEVLEQTEPIFRLTSCSAILLISAVAGVEISLLISAGCELTVSSLAWDPLMP